MIGKFASYISPLLVFAMTLSSLHAHARSIATEVTDPSFPGVLDITARAELRTQRLVDFTKYPELKETYSKVVSLVDSLLIPEDGSRPIRVVITDSLDINAQYLFTTKGDRVISISLGMLGFAQNDDELAYIIGHELEHGLSNINSKVRRELPNKIRRRDEVGAAYLMALDRVGENEADTKSVFRRVQKKGFNPYAARDIMLRMLEDFGDEIAETHTLMSSRINAVEIELTGMSRVTGTDMTRRPTQDVVGPKIGHLFASADFLDRRRQAAAALNSSYAKSAKSLAREIAGVSSLPADLRMKKKTEISKHVAAVLADFRAKTIYVNGLFGNLLSAQERLDFELRHQGAFVEQLLGEIDKALKALGKPSDLDQMLLLERILEEPIFRSIMSNGYQQNPLMAIDDEIRSLQDYRGYSNSEKRSRGITIERKIADLKKYRALILSGYSDPNTVERISREATAIRGGYGSKLSPEYFKKVAETEEHVKYVGPWLKKRGAMAREVRRNAAWSLIDAPQADVRQVSKTLQFLSLAERKEFVEKFFEKGVAELETLAEQVRAGEKNSAPKLRSVLGSYFDFEIEDAFSSNGVGYEVLRRESPDKFRSLAKRMSLAIVEAASDAASVSEFVGVINPDNNSRVLQYSDAFTRRFEVRKDLAVEIFDDTYLQRAVEKIGHIQKQAIESQGKIKRMQEFLALVEPQLETLNRVRTLYKLGSQKVAKTTSVLALKDLEKHFRDSFTGPLKDVIDKYPSVMGDMLEIRDFEDPTKNPDSELARSRALLERITKLATQLEIDASASNLLRGAFDFDKVLRLAKALKSESSVLSVISKNPSLFVSDRPKHASSLQDGLQSIADRANLFEIARSRKVTKENRETIGRFAFTMIHSNELDRSDSAKIVAAQEAAEKKASVAVFLDQFRAASSLPVRERYRLGFDAVIKTIGSIDSHNVAAISNALVKAERKTNVFELLDVFRENLKSYSRMMDGNEFSSHIKGYLRHVFSVVVGEFETAKSVRGLSTEEKIAILRFRMETSDVEPMTDIIIDELWPLRDRNPSVRTLLADERVVSSLYYDTTKRQIALWQLDKKHRVDEISRALTNGQQSVPGKLQERRVIRELQATIDKQFPTDSSVKESVLNQVEDLIRTSQAESRILRSSRIDVEKWFEVSELVFADMPDFLSKNMQSSYDRMQSLEFLIGTRPKIPEFVYRLNEDQREKVLSALPHFRSRFSQAPSAIRAAILQPLFDRDFGLLSDPAMTSNVHKLILGEKYNDPIIRRLFEAYLESAPEAETKVLLSHVMSSFVDSPPGSKGASLKTVLEAMGPFGIRAGQFLHTSGLLPAKYTGELKGFLDNALPPNRPRVIEDLENALGKELRAVVKIDRRAGSGSINYVQALTVEKDGKKIDVVARIRRPYIEGIVANENRIWEKLIEKFRASGTPDELAVADVIDQTRTQVFTTLRAGGPELDLSQERGAFERAGKIYGKKITEGRLAGFSVDAAKPDLELQKLVAPEYQSLVSFYEKIDHVSLDSITDPELREALAKEITKLELDALFNKDSFDADGHPGNWLIDLKNKRIVRIDYAQLQTTTDGERKALGVVLGELSKFKPNFSKPETRKALATLLQVSDASVDLEAAISRVGSQFSWSIDSPQQRLFKLRRNIQSAIDPTGNIQVKIGDTMRNAFASLSKINAYREFMGPGEFHRLLAEHSTIPGYLVNLATFKERVTSALDNTVGLMKQRLSRRLPKPTIDNSEPTKAEVARASAVIHEHSSPPERIVKETSDVTPTLPMTAGTPSDPFNKLSASSEVVGGKTAQTNVENGSSAKKLPSPAEDKKATRFIKLDLDYWKPRSPDAVYAITPAMFESLPDGTELYSIFDEGGAPKIKGVDYIEEDTRFGRIPYGVRGKEYLKYGGPTIANVIIGPPPGLSLEKNIYATTPSGLRVLLLTPEQYNQLPEGTVLFQTDDQRFIKTADSPRPPLRKGYVQLGFPDISQKGFEKFGAHGCHVEFMNLGKAAAKP